MKKIKFIFLFLVGLLIVSCGFHLRGNQDISDVLPEIKTQGINKHSDFGRELYRTLTAAKVNILDESNTVLIIKQNNVSKRVLSVDSAGRANQYELNYELRFSLMEIIQGESLKYGNSKQLNKFVDLVPEQTIHEKREYLFDADLILAKADEENRLISDMRQSVILQLVRRLSFSLKAKNKANK